MCVKKIGQSAHSVVCPACQYDTCVKCVKTFLASVPGGVLKCMNCHANFTQDFVAESLGTTFLKKEYRKLREDALFEVQLALIADTMPMLEAIKERKLMEQHLETLVARKLELQQLINDVNLQMAQQRENIEAVNTAVRTGNGVAAAAEVKKHSCKCLNANCNGVMSHTPGVDELMRCAACNGSACVHCHAILDINSQNSQNSEHVCDADNVATVAEIQRSSKPCPGCGHGIHRIEGCSTMFCTVCHTAFDYHTGATQTRDVHNPHFFDWLQDNPEAGAAYEEDRIDEFMEQRALNQGQGCQPIEPIDLGSIREVFGVNNNQYREVMAIHRLTLHMRDEVRTLGNVLQQATNTELAYRDLRINYILKDITDTDFKREMFVRERANDKKVACHQLYDMLVKVLIDMGHRLIANGRAYAAIMVEAASLRLYFNKMSQDIAKRFTSKTITILPNWEVTDGARRRART